MITWVMLPHWLCRHGLTTAACMVYAMLADRHHLSMQSHAERGTWADSRGVYCIYPRADLAAAVGVSVGTITRAMRELVAAGLIIDHRMGQGMPNRIYVLDRAAEDIPKYQQAQQITLDDLTQEPGPAPAQPAQEPAPAPAQPAQEPGPAPAQPAQEPAPAEPAAAPRIANTATLQSQYQRVPPYNHINNRIIARSHDTSIDQCLATAYGIDPTTIPDDIRQTAADRCARARNVRNPITYTAAIIAQLCAQRTAATTPPPLSEADMIWLADMQAWLADMQTTA